MNGIDIWIFRLNENMTQKQIAEKLGVSTSLISYLERGGKMTERTKKQMELLIENAKLKGDM